MIHLLNLLAAIALLVSGTHIVRTGMLRVLGDDLRRVLAASCSSRLHALAAGIGVTSLVQSSAATCLIVSSFVGKNLVATSAALAVMLGANVGTGLMTVVLSFDLSWLSPLFILVGVVVFISRQDSGAGAVGRALIGLGLIILALQLIVAATRPLIDAPAVRTLLMSLPDDAILDIVVGAVLAVLSYSSLAIILLIASLASSGIVPETVALGLVLGSNIGSGILAVLTTANASSPVRRLPLGNLVFKALGVLLLVPFLPEVNILLQQVVPGVHERIVVFHLFFNAALAVVFIGATGLAGRTLDRSLREPTASHGSARPRHLDPLVLHVPSLAISCAVREAVHQADVVEAMLRGIGSVLRSSDLRTAEDLRKLDDTVDELHSAIKFYLTQISGEALSEDESRRWTDIVSFTINMEQVGDIVERVLQDIEDKKVKKALSFSAAGMAEIVHLHERLLSNLHLAMSVFLDGNVREANRLLEEKARFRDLERQYVANHIARLRENTVQSIETSSLHLDLISDLKRINSHLCSIAYPILESAGALTKTRLRQPQVAAFDSASGGGNLNLVSA